MRFIARREGLVVQEMDNEIMVYDLKTNKASCLNETAALVWQNCDGKRNAEEIAEVLSIELKTKVDRNVVDFALYQLQTEKLLEQESSESSPFADLSRRDVIKRVGLSSLVALPIIATLTAPVAAQMGSCMPQPAMNPTGCPCGSPSECAMNCTGGTCA